MYQRPTDSDAVHALRVRLALSGRIYEQGRLREQIRAQRLREARARGTHTDEEWREKLAQYDYRCVRCGCTPLGRPCKDHIVPIYRGGSDSIDNLQPLCRECNSSKGPDAFNWADYRDTHGFGEEIFVVEELC